MIGRLVAKALELTLSDWLVIGVLTGLTQAVGQKLADRAMSPGTHVHQTFLVDGVHEGPPGEDG